MRISSVFIDLQPILNKVFQLDKTKIKTVFGVEVKDWSTGLKAN